MNNDREPLIVEFFKFLVAIVIFPFVLIIGLSMAAFAFIIDEFLGLIVFCAIVGGIWLGYEIAQQGNWLGWLLMGGCLLLGLFLLFLLWRE